LWRINVTENTQFHAAVPHGNGWEKEIFVFFIIFCSPQAQLLAILRYRPAPSTDPGRGDAGSSSALCPDAPTCCPGVEPSVFPLLSRSARQQQAAGSPGGEPPAGTAALRSSYFAKSGELKVTLKMEGSRSVTYGLLIRLPL